MSTCHKDFFNADDHEFFVVYRKLFLIAKHISLNDGDGNVSKFRTLCKLLR